ncbi:helix-hairpin-helix domain-containing protein [Clostridium sp. SYSU_GA19001]|uniref:helix-hairpin-helix domain-containing protein n=1 Tax=Clostridium caldaquaticum TaxID=2940653 RepID=UPI00207736EA|nr:helix-hairpin-helix domain-containing protein [Clostridium caldaquaticum]MCM8710388.1 helix-hairpin-helix domain-containing protein [Clostridium caldaquaticum]
MKAKQKIIGSIVILIILAIFLVVGYIVNRPKSYKFNEDDIFVESTFSEERQNNEIKTITVYIKGEVKKPGVYRLKAGSIVDDLVRLAGGLTENANPDSKLNLAKKLKDEDYIYVDKKIELEPSKANSTIIVQEQEKSSKVNINSATLKELDEIPGIGPVTAQKIIDYREKNGYFTSIEDLKKVGGIGEKTLDKFRDMVDIR